MVFMQNDNFTVLKLEHINKYHQGYSGAAIKFPMIWSSFRVSAAEMIR